MEIQIFHGSNEIVISFHTLQALDCITFLRSETVYDGKTEK